LDATACRRWACPTAKAVATVVYAKRALDHIERAFAFLSEKNPGAAQNAVIAIQSAVDNLAAHPLIGRRLEGELRELIISYGHSGYVALYRFVVSTDEVRILAIRHQREVGFIP
jgi:plasmid stabilization system protein ParE